MIITVSGNAGSGKSTVAKILEKKLNMKRYYIGGIRRETARKRGLTLEEYNELGEKDPSTDIEVDEYQKNLGKTEDNFIIEGRTSYHFIPNSVKLYFYADPKVGANRVWNDLQENGNNRNEAKVDNINELMTSMIKRQKSDEMRYKKYYDINPFDKTNYDFVIDTSFLTVEQVVEKVINYIKTR